jgi:UDP-N-acetylglucosamine 2-epimerase
MSKASNPFGDGTASEKIIEFFKGRFIWKKVFI